MNQSSLHDTINRCHADASLGELALEFERIQAQMNLLDEFSKSIGACPKLGREQAAYFSGVQERLASTLHDEMRRIGELAVTIPARTSEELAAKAKIWLGRWIPEPNDDVLALAASICRDLTATAPPERHRRNQ